MESSGKIAPISNIHQPKEQQQYQRSDSRMETLFLCAHTIHFALIIPIPSPVGVVGSLRRLPFGRIDCEQGGVGEREEGPAGK